MTSKPLLAHLFEQALRVQGELSRLTLAGVLLDTLHCYTGAVYQQMGLDEAIAASPEAYVAKAARFANDRDYRTMFSRYFNEVGGELFEDRQAVRDFENFLERALAKR